MSLHQNNDGTIEFTDGQLSDVLREWTKTPCCVDGWVPGEFGIERCDNCKRFKCDDDAAKHVQHVINTLVANAYVKPNTDKIKEVCEHPVHSNPGLIVPCPECNANNEEKDDGDKLN